MYRSDPRPLLVAIAMLAAFMADASAEGRHRVTRFDPIIRVEAVPGRVPVKRNAEVPCDAGGVYQPFDSYDDIVDPGVGTEEVYYTMIDPAECAGCTDPEPQMRIDFVHLSLWFPTTCVQPIDVAFVEPGLPVSCPRPNEARVIAGPFTFNLPGVPSTGEGAPRFDLTLPTTVYLTHRAFLAITFNSYGTCDTQLEHTEIVYGDTTACVSCRYWNYSYDSGGPNKYDFCIANNPPTPHYRIGPPVMYASGDCGTFVPVLPTSWGRLKIRYATPRRRRRRLVRRTRTGVLT